MDNKTFSDIIHFAIEKEILSNNFYVKASDASRFDRIKKMFLQCAAEGEEHRELLYNLNTEKISNLQIDPEFDFNIDDCFNDVEFRNGMPYVVICRMAIKMEECFISLYGALKDATSNQDLKNIFSRLANEKEKHKNKFEEELFGK